MWSWLEAGFILLSPGGSGEHIALQSWPLLEARGGQPFVPPKAASPWLRWAPGSEWGYPLGQGAGVAIWQGHFSREGEPASYYNQHSPWQADGAPAAT